MIPSTIDLSLNLMSRLFTHIQYSHLIWKWNDLVCVCSTVCVCLCSSSSLWACTVLSLISSVGVDIAWADTFIWTKAPWVSLGKLQVKKKKNNPKNKLKKHMLIKKCHVTHWKIKLMLKEKNKRAVKQNRSLQHFLTKHILLRRRKKFYSLQDLINWVSFTA